MGYGYGPFGGELGFAARTGFAWRAETLAAIAAMTSAPAETRKQLLNTLIAGLIDDGVWAKLDWLSPLAAHDAQAGRLNLVNPAQAMTAVNAPTFTVDRGYAGDGATSYLTSGWNPTQDAVNFAINSASMGIWSRGPEVAENVRMMGNSISTLNARNTTNNAIAWANSSTNQNRPLSTITALGLTAWTRDGAATGAIYKDGAALGAITTTAAAALQNGDFFVGCYNNNGVDGQSPLSFTSQQIAVVWWAGGLTAGEQLAAYNRLHTYLVAVGAA